MKPIRDELPLTATEEKAEQELQLHRAAANKLSEEQKQKKKVIAERLQCFREAGGLGCICLLARASGVYASVIRQMLLAEPVPYETWCKVGHGLEKLEKSAAARM